MLFNFIRHGYSSKIIKRYICTVCILPIAKPHITDKQTVWAKNHGVAGLVLLKGENIIGNTGIV